MRVDYDYDDYGNTTVMKEYNFDGAVLKKTVVNYVTPNTQDWILGKPKSSIIYEGDGTEKVSETRFYYDGNSLEDAPIKGSLTREERWLKRSVPPQEERYIATTYGYDSYGNVTSVTDALNHTTTTTYDTATNTFPYIVTNHLGYTQKFNYDPKIGRIETSEDQNGQITTSKFDGFGRLKKVTGPGGLSETSYTYILDTFPTKVITTKKIKDGESVTSYDFIDGLGRKILSRTQAEYKGSLKHIVSDEVECDSRGQIIKRYIPYYIDVPSPEDSYIAPTCSTLSMTYRYDAMGKLTQTIRPDNKVSQNIYSINTIETINENSQRTTQTKDVYGRITEIKDADGNVTNYEYDALGNLTDTYDSATPRNYVHVDYDSLGRKVLLNDPDMGSWSYEYDDVGNLTKQADAKGNILEFQYDNINRLKYKIANGQTIVTYTYDVGTYAKGRLSKIKVEATTNTTEFAYDALGRETATTRTIDGTSYAINREYDGLDRIISVTYPNDTIPVTYEYVRQGGIKKIFQGAGVVYVVNAEYRATGQIEEVEYGNGRKTTYEYEPNNLSLSRLATSDLQGADVIQDLSYTFDPLGNVKSITDSKHTNTQYFNYDSLNRLTSATGDSYGTIGYDYDSIGNMRQKQGLTLTYGEDGAGPHAVTSVSGDESYTIKYDKNGNMIEKNTTIYTYDTENRLVKCAIPRVGEVSILTIELTAGWNFFSLPYRNISLKPDGTLASPEDSGTLTAIEDIPIKTILSGVTYDQVSKYDEFVNDPNTGHWQHYVGNIKFDQFPKLTSGEDCHFTYGEGYLIYVTASSSIAITGSTPGTPQQKTLNAGWNLVLSPTSASISVQDSLEGVTYDSVKHYNGTTYDDATVFEAGEAYWIRIAAGTQTWNIKAEEETTEYVYDDSHRIKRITKDTTTIYIGSIYEIDETTDTTTKKKHIFMGKERVCTVEEEDTTINACFIHPDHVGSSNIITDRYGDVVSNVEYQPYGLTTTHEGSYNTDKLFNGRAYDKTSSLIDYGGRLFDPDLGRWLTPDPTIQRPYDPQNLNRYSFVQNNPINSREINGYGFWSKLWNWFKNNWQGILAVTMIVVSVAVMLVAPVTIPYMFPTLIAQVSGAIIGGTSAAARGGNIGSGMLFGVLAGTATGGSLGAMSKLGYGGFTLGEMAMAAEAGGAASATRGYAGGKGSVQDIIKQAALGAGTAAIVAGAFGILQGHPLLPETGQAGIPVTPTGAEGKADPTTEAAGASSPGTSGGTDNITPPNQEQKAGKQLSLVEPEKTTPPPTPAETREKKIRKISWTQEQDLKSILSQRYKPYRNIKPGYAPSDLGQAIEYMIRFPGLFN